MEASYENTGVNPTKNGIYIASVVTKSGAASMKIFTVQSLYAKTLNFFTPNVLTNLGFNSIEEIETGLASYGANIDIAIANAYQAYSNLLNYTDTVDYSDSVEANGGFYVGRYEAGATKTRVSGNNSATVTQIISTNGIPVCNANQTPYNYVTQSQAKELTESMYNGKNFTCSLLTGASWDRTLGFLTEAGSNNKELVQVYDESREWGNYREVSFDVTNTSAKYSENDGKTYTQITETYPRQAYTDILLTTGATTRNSAKNIYDLAGNVWEWTLETNGSSVVSRGGSYGNVGDITAFTRFDSDTSGYYNNVGFRPALYL